MPAGMQAVLLPYFKLWLFVEKLLNYCSTMRLQCALSPLRLLPITLANFLIPTTSHGLIRH